MGAADSTGAEEREFTEEELTGAEASEGGEEAVKDDPAGETAEADGETATPKEPKQDEAATDSDSTSTTASKSGKPPEGHVPLQALHEEREARRALKAELDALKAAAAASKAPAIDPKEMILEDPEAAVEALVGRIAALETEIQRRDLESKINSAVPDFLEIAPKMEQAMLEEGLTEQGISRIIGAAGVEAPAFFKLLSKTIKARGTADLERQITEKVTKELTAKFLSGEGTKDIGRLPGAASEAKVKVDGEKGFAKLSPEQQEAYLRGEF